MSIGRLRRVGWVLVALAWFVWIGLEDRTLDTLLVVPILFSIPLSLEVWRRLAKGGLGRRSRFLLTLLIGPLAGASIPLTAALLILIKTSIHSHTPADFSLEDLRKILLTLPVWIAAGALAGAGAGLLVVGTGARSIAGPQAVEYNEMDPEDEGDGVDDGRW